MQMPVHLLVRPRLESSPVAGQRRDLLVPKKLEQVTSWLKTYGTKLMGPL